MRCLKTMGGRKWMRRCYTGGLGDGSVREVGRQDREDERMSLIESADERAVGNINSLTTDEVWQWGDVGYAVLRSTTRGAHGRVEPSDAERRCLKDPRRRRRERRWMSGRAAVGCARKARTKELG